MNIKLRSKLMSIGLVMALNIGMAQAADQYGGRHSDVNAAPGGGDIAPLTQLAPWGTTGLPPKLFPRSTASWICDPKTGSFELTMKKQLEFKLKTEASVRIGPVITGTISTGKIMVKKGLQGTKPWKPWVQITEVVMKDSNIEFHHFGGPTVVSIADLPDF